MGKPNIFQKSPIVRDEQPGSYYWCACGLSKSQPFCDGSHKGTEFTPMKIDITEEKKVSWCACKQTENHPYCDGTHKNL